MTRLVDACLAVMLVFFVAALLFAVIGFGHITLSMIGAI